MNVFAKHYVLEISPVSTNVRMRKSSSLLYLLNNYNASAACILVLASLAVFPALIPLWTVFYSLLWCKKKKPLKSILNLCSHTVKTWHSYLHRNNGLNVFTVSAMVWVLSVLLCMCSWCTDPLICACFIAIRQTLVYLQHIQAICFVCRLECAGVAGPPGHNGAPLSKMQAMWGAILLQGWGEKQPYLAQAATEPEWQKPNVTDRCVCVPACGCTLQCH